MAKPMCLVSFFFTCVVVWAMVEVLDFMAGAGSLFRFVLFVCKSERK